MKAAAAIFFRDADVCAMPAAFILRYAYDALMAPCRRHDALR